MDIEEEKTQEIPPKTPAIKDKKLRKQEYRQYLSMLKKANIGFWKEFKAFITKGNILNLAIAFIMGAAFTAIVNSLVEDIIMPVISIFFAKESIGDLHWTVSSNLTVYYGKFILAIVKFLLIALVLFFVIKIVTGAGRQIKMLKKGGPLPPPPPPPETTESILKDIRELLRKENPPKPEK
jgi:large conductance mechanosensitive channel